MRVGRDERLEGSTPSSSAECLGVVPGTYIICGEGGNHCSEACLQERLRREKKKDWFADDCGDD